MSAVVISKSPSVVVQPSEEEAMATCDIKLSPYDTWFVSSPVTTFYVFEHAIQKPVETIKRGLSQALVHYYPMAGRLAAGATAGEVVIKCTPLEGVPFVAASANCAMEDVKDLADPSLQEELAVFFQGAGGMCGFSDALLMMQVTVFSCGGFVLGVTRNHAVADGTGMGQFMRAVGKLSRGLPSPSVVPVRQSDSIILGPPPAFIKYIYFLGSLQPCQMAILDITVKASLVNHIKDMYASINSGRPCTVFEAVTAVLWRCRTRVIMSESDPEARTVITFSTNARKYAGAKEGYYGNCLLGHLVTASTGAVANGHFLDIVKMIRGAKDRAPDHSDIDELVQLKDTYNLLNITSWRNMEEPDFGAGRPTKIMMHSRGISLMPACTVCIPCKEEYNVLSICVKEAHASAFLQELSDMHLNYSIH